MHAYLNHLYFYIESRRIGSNVSGQRFSDSSIKSVGIDDLAVEIERAAIFPIFEATTEIAVASGNETCV